MKRKPIRIFLIFFIPFYFSSCKNDVSRELKIAWLKDDKEFIENYLNKIEKLEPEKFYQEVMYLNNAFNFSYGVIDPQDVKKWTENEKKIREKKYFACVQSIYRIVFFQTEEYFK